MADFDDEFDDFFGDEPSEPKAPEPQKNVNKKIKKAQNSSIGKPTDRKGMSYSQKKNLEKTVIKGERKIIDDLFDDFVEKDASEDEIDEVVVSLNGLNLNTEEDYRILAENCMKKVSCGSDANIASFLKEVLINSCVKLDNDYVGDLKKYITSLASDEINYFTGERKGMERSVREIAPEDFALDGAVGIPIGTNSGNEEEENVEDDLDDFF